MLKFEGFEKQAKNLNETDSNLSFYTRLTRIKRLRRNCFYDTIPDRLQSSRITMLVRI